MVSILLLRDHLELREVTATIEIKLYLPLIDYNISLAVVYTDYTASGKSVIAICMRSIII
jgi:hypothetical protein